MLTSFVSVPTRSAQAVASLRRAREAVDGVGMGVGCGDGPARSVRQVGHYLLGRAVAALRALAGGRVVVVASTELAQRRDSLICSSGISGPVVFSNLYPTR